MTLNISLNWRFSINHQKRKTEIIKWIRRFFNSSFKM